MLILNKNHGPINKQFNLSNNWRYLSFDPLLPHPPWPQSRPLSACLLPHCCVYPAPLCLTGDLHGDSRHATLWCFLHGLSLHNGEQQRQRYCLIPSRSSDLFASLATFSDLPCCSAPLLASILKPLLLPLSFPLFSVKQAPWSVGERAGLVWVPATWSLTLLVLTLTLNLPGGQLSEVFSLHWCIFEFLSPHCLLKHCVPALCTCKLLKKKWIGSLCLIRCHSSCQGLKTGDISHSLAATPKKVLPCFLSLFIYTLCKLIGIHKVTKIIPYSYICLHLSKCIS